MSEDSIEDDNNEYQMLRMRSICYNESPFIEVENRPQALNSISLLFDRIIRSILEELQLGKPPTTTMASS